MKSTSRNYFEAIRLIDSKSTEYDYGDSIIKLVEEKEIEEFDISTINRLHNNFMNNDDAVSYMKSRGINIETAVEFKIGYSDKQQMVTVPVQDHLGTYVGFVGRSVFGKSFKNSQGLPRRHILFNLNRNKYEKIVVVESSFDAIRLWQLGIPSVATLGSYISREQLELLAKWSSSVVIAPDKDEAGEKLVKKIKDSINKDVSVVEIPGDKKDIGDLSNNEIIEIIDKNSSILI
jgi:DNA primase